MEAFFSFRLHTLYVHLDEAIEKRFPMMEGLDYHHQAHNHTVLQLLPVVPQSKHLSLHHPQPSTCSSSSSVQSFLPLCGRT